MKTAIFVEGSTELILIREYLLRIFEYQNIDLRCLALRGGELEEADYDIKNEEAENHFMIINAGSDTSVIKYILKREEYFIKENYDKIIGLRDMYCENYFHFDTKRKIVENINQRFIQESQNTILEEAQQPDKIKICFAIMETEAWFLGLHEIFEKIDKRLTVDFINDKIGINLQEIDPEAEIFHPATLVKKIYKLVDKNYGKSTADINTITGQLSKQDYETLLARNKCNSFNTFHESIFI